MLVKCKPVYNFQSVEFEMEVKNPEDIEIMFDMYEDMIKGLKSVAPEQPAQPKAAPAKPQAKEEMATNGQINYLIGLGFDEEEAKKLTKKQADLKIKEML